MIRTFIDAGVLIYAARSQGDMAERVFEKFLEVKNYANRLSMIRIMAR